MFERPDYAKLLEMADRESLSVPTEYCFATTTIEFAIAQLSVQMIRQNLNYFLFLTNARHLYML